MSALRKPLVGSCLTMPVGVCIRKNTHSEFLKKKNDKKMQFVLVLGLLSTSKSCLCADCFLKQRKEIKYLHILIYIKFILLNNEKMKEANKKRGINKNETHWFGFF